MRTLLLTCAFAACAFGQGTTATTTVTRDYNFPPVGLATTETAQVNVLNVAKASTAAGATAPACTGTITFTNASGDTIGKATSFTTAGSQIFSAQLTSSELAATGTRGEFVAGIQLTTAIPAKAPCSLVFSIETFDTTTGATHVFLANPATAAASPIITPFAVH